MDSMQGSKITPKDSLQQIPPLQTLVPTQITNFNFPHNRRGDDLRASDSMHVKGAASRKLDNFMSPRGIPTTQ